MPPEPTVIPTNPPRILSALVLAVALAACGNDDRTATNRDADPTDSGSTDDIAPVDDTTRPSDPDPAPDLPDTAIDPPDATPDELDATSDEIDVLPDEPDTDVDVPTFPRDDAERWAWADACVHVILRGADPQRRAIVRTPDNNFELGPAERATPFLMRAADLGVYVLRDDTGGFLVGTDEGIARQVSPETDISRIEDGFRSPAEWDLELPPTSPSGFALRNRSVGTWLASDGLAVGARDAALLDLQQATGCAPYPEMSLDAEGTVQPREWPDGDVWGFVDAHSHILSNFGFGGGGIFHGAPFHPLGVEHAMGDCTPFHAEGGRADFLGWGFGSGSRSRTDENELITLLATGRLPQDHHATDGWPTFSGWPSQYSATHQTQYWRWLERAWMSGLRLVVQHAVSNEAFCDLMADTEYQPVRWACDDMLNIDRQLVEIRNLERYIDAQAGGPGRGFLRIVTTPEEAREVIGQGKLAVILGIEVPNLFSCYLSPKPGQPDCTPEHIDRELDRYHDQGVRVLFPNHKYDNAFSPGDGHRGIVEIGNFYTTAHWNNFGHEDCPDVPSVFDRGDVLFGGLNQPREDYLAPPPHEFIELSPRPLRELIPWIDEIRQPRQRGDFCQNAGLTDAGKHLINGMMDRGIIIELDHLPRRAYVDAFSMLEEADYPGAGTHGNTNRGRLYALGGRSKTEFSRCADPDQPGALSRPFRDRREQIEAAGGYPSEGFAFDLNGLAGVPGPRFGPNARCEKTQENPVEWPFTSWDGSITFTQPRIGERVIDFNTEGMIHIGLLPEFIEDARRTGSSDDDLEFLFRSAEGYLRMWEKAERRAEERRRERRNSAAP